MIRTTETQLHRGADNGYRNSNNQNLRRDCERETHVKYGWTLDHSPIGSTPSRKHWECPSSLRRKFLKVNYVFTPDGRKIKVV